MCERESKLAATRGCGTIHCRFRIISRTGEEKRMLAEARLVRHETYGDVFFVVCVALDEL